MFGNLSNSGTSTRDLTIENTSVANRTAAVQITSLGSGTGATYCTVKNCIIRSGLTGIGNAYTNGLSAGSTIGSTGSDNDNLTIVNNILKIGSNGGFNGLITIRF